MEFVLTPVFQQVPEGYIAFVEELPGANTQGETLAEARAVSGRKPLRSSWRPTGLSRKI